jgi:hypothetical protein
MAGQFLAGHAAHPLPGVRLTPRLRKRFLKELYPEYLR